MSIKTTGRNWVRRGMGLPAVAPTLRLTSRLGLLPRAVWQRLPVQLDFEVDRVDFRYSSVFSDAIGRTLYWRGVDAYEPETTGWFSNLARRAECVLDIGANTGLYTLLALAARPDNRVISFEPVPQIRRRLQANLAANGWESRCEVLGLAVSDHVGSTEFHVPRADLPTSASLHPEGFRHSEGERIHIDVTTVDRICVDRRVDLVKIDVEGFEDHVLRGMRQVLERDRPELIVECNPDGPNAEIEAILREHGYRFHHLRDDGPQPRDGIIPDPTERFRNYYCSARD